MAILLIASLIGCQAPPSAGATQSVRGVLLDVVSPSFSQLDRFTLRTDDGRELTFVTAPDFNAGAAHAMTPGHMRQHMALGDPVVVTYRDDGAKFVALSATDATASP